jgi:hypothetical protein
MNTHKKNLAASCHLAPLGYNCHLSYGSSQQLSVSEMFVDPLGLSFFMESLVNGKKLKALSVLFFLPVS